MHTWQVCIGAITNQKCVSEKGRLVHCLKHNDTRGSIAESIYYTPVYIGKFDTIIFRSVADPVGTWRANAPFQKNQTF